MMGEWSFGPVIVRGIDSWDAYVIFCELLGAEPGDPSVLDCADSDSVARAQSRFIDGSKIVAVRIRGEE